jgi:hypothetical protein
MRTLCLVIGLSSLTSAMVADTVTFKDGTVITGAYLGGSAREIKIETGDEIRMLSIENIARIDFAAGRETARGARQTSAGSIRLQAGTHLVIRMIDGVDSERNRVGQTFAASLDEPVMVNGETVMPRGADVTVKLVDASESGKLTGRTILTLDLMSVRVNGRMVDVNTETVKEESSSRGARTAKVAGGTAALGTIIGAVAGGGKGAAIGLASGAAVGAGVEILTKGQRVKIPSETRLTFTLENDVHI